MRLHKQNLLKKIQINSNKRNDVCHIKKNEKIYFVLFDLEFYKFLLYLKSKINKKKRINIQ